MMKNKWGKKVIEGFGSERFKKISLVAGGAFIVVTFLISINPKPFLKYGYPGAFLFSLVGPATFLMPTMSRHLDVLLSAVILALGMAINDSVSWLVGRGGDIVLPRSKRVIRAEKRLHKYGPGALFFWALIPFPYDFIGVIAGYLEFSYISFLVPTFLGRMVRFILMGSGIVAVWGKIS